MSRPVTASFHPHVCCWAPLASNPGHAESLKSSITSRGAGPGMGCRDTGIAAKTGAQGWEGGLVAMFKLGDSLRMQVYLPYLRVIYGLIFNSCWDSLCLRAALRMGLILPRGFWFNSYQLVLYQAASGVAGGYRANWLADISNKAMNPESNICLILFMLSDNTCITCSVPH